VICSGSASSALRTSVTNPDVAHDARAELTARSPPASSSAAISRGARNERLRDSRNRPAHVGNRHHERLPSQGSGSRVRKNLAKANDRGLIPPG
jgi:hypothetical protein